MCLAISKAQGDSPDNISTMADVPPTTKEEVKRLQGDLNRKKDSMRKAKSREDLPWEAQVGWDFCFQCALVFEKETTKYTASLALLLQKDHSRKKVWSADSEAKGKELVNKVVEKAKENKEKWEQAYNNCQHGAHWKAEEVLNQYQLAKTLQELNCKGVSVPSSVLMQNYIDLWGPQPWTEQTAAHIKRLADPKKAKKWRNSFRKKWNFKYAKMSDQTPIHDDDVSMKAWG